MIEVVTELAANVWQLRCAVGDELAEGEEIAVLESMKMEIPITAPQACRVAELLVAPNDAVDEGAVVARIEPR